MKTNFKYLFSVLFLFVTTLLLAQVKTITGTVKDENGDPVSDAIVTVKSTGVSATTDFEGNFSIEAQQGDVLNIDAIGYSIADQSVGSSSTINFKAKASQLDEVVATALGISREKKSLGYATQGVSGEEISKVPQLNFATALQGEVAGLNAQSFGSMGGSANLVVRGFSSLYGSNQALVVIDGVIIDNSIQTSGNQKTGRGGYDYGNNAMDIDPNNVASVEVLKGSAATALYGSRAANGALIITTKKGNKGKGLGINFTSSYVGGWADKTTLPRYQNQYGAGYGPYYDDPTGYFLYDDFNGDGTPDLLTPFTEDASYGAKFNPSLLVYQWNSIYPQLTSTYKVATPWIAGKHTPNDFLNASSNFTNTVSIAAGDSDANFNLTYSNNLVSGILPNSKIKKNSFGLTGGRKFGKLLASAGINYINTNGKGRYGTGYSSQNQFQAFREWFQMNVDMEEQRKAYEQTGENITWNPNSQYNLAPIYTDNAYWMRYNNYSTDDRNRYIGNANLTYEITKGLSILGRLNGDFYTETQEERINKGASDVAKYSVRNATVSEVNYDLILSYNKNITPNINLDANLGWNLQVRSRSVDYAETNGGLVNKNLFTLSNSANPLTPDNLSNYDATKKVDGEYGRLSLGFYDTYFVEGTYRTDRSSALPKANNRYGYYSVAGSILFNKFVKANWLDLGKIRGNYAQVGNDTDPYNVYNTYILNAPFNGNASATNPSTFNNVNLKSETTKEYEFGLEMNMFKGRLGLDVSYYNRKTYDLLTPLVVTTSTGASNVWLNAGNTENKGFEFFLRATPVKSKGGFQWDINFNFSNNRSKVLALAQGVEYIGLGSTTGAVQSGVQIGARVGDPFGVIRGSDFVYTNGQKTVGANGRYLKTGNDQILGDINPDWTGGVKNTLSYKGFDFSFLIDIKQGGSVFNLDTWYGYATGLYDQSVGNNDLGNPIRNTLATGGGNILPGVYANGNPNTTRVFEGYYANSYGYSRAPHAMHVYDASFVKLRQASISYRIPDDFFGETIIRGLTVSLIGRNLWIISKKVPYADPEAGLSAGNVQGYQSGTYPSVREIGASVNFNF